ncbi:MalY/PatB family protein [Nigerium massiliense]|uniref:MalY/PatB family protein n=1 Tax=Nigerium massiliense TaxID=1522317 RepID=UPI0006947522|nr:aminotransferase class I/II-fold pyridoxal phosphate-dependent enzyme [Nigerium massiliense]
MPLNLPEQTLRQRSSMKWRMYDADVLPLWVAEMDVAMHPAVRAAIDEALDASDTGYPAGNEYQEAFAAMAAARWDWHPDPATEIARVGDVMNAMLSMLQGLTEEGDHVVINPPIYPPFRQIVTGYKRHLTEVPLVDDRLDLDGLRAAFAGPDKPTAYLLCSPHNPTGTVHTREELAAVGELCAEFGVHLLADEIHNVLVDPGTEFVPLLSVPACSHAMVATSAGKGWNLAGFKGGLIIRGTDAADKLAALPPLARQSGGQFAKIAHTAAMRHAQGWVDDLMAEVSANKDLLQRLLAEQLPAVVYRRAPGTYLAWLDCSALGLENPSLHFRTKGKVALNNGSDFGPEYGQFVRMNLAAAPELITEAVTRMASSLER